MTTWHSKHLGPGWYWLACPVNPYTGQALYKPWMCLARVLDVPEPRTVEPTVVDIISDTGEVTAWLIGNLPDACLWQPIRKPKYPQPHAPQTPRRR